MLTFIAYAKRKGFAPVQYTSAASGLLGKDESGNMRFIELVIRPTVEVAAESDAPKARDLFRAIEGKCFIGSSLRVEPKVEPTIVVQNVGSAAGAQ